MADIPLQDANDVAKDDTDLAAAARACLRDSDRSGTRKALSPLDASYLLLTSLSTSVRAQHFSRSLWLPSSPETTYAHLCAISSRSNRSPYNSG